MPELDKRNQNSGERRKPFIIFAVVGVILVGIFLIIIFFFHSNLRSGAPFRSWNYPESPTRALASRHAPDLRPPAAKARAFALRRV